MRWAVLSAVLLLLLRTFAVQGLLLPVRISGMSMGASFEGRRVLIDRAAMTVGVPRLARWELIAIRTPGVEDRLAIKRVIGLPGETVEIQRGKIWIDGHRLTDIPSAVRDVYYLGAWGNPLPWRMDRPLAEDEYFVLGDNPEVSHDSRNWHRGVRKKHVAGSVLVWR